MKNKFEIHAVITTIQEPTASVHVLVNRLSEVNGKLIVAGDSKGPQSYTAPIDRPWPVEFLSLSSQQSSIFKLAKNLPENHYARKNIAYLKAIACGALCIYETDDDNAPMDQWQPRSEFLARARVVPEHDSRWINVYRYFSSDTIWPRGLPLDEISKSIPDTQMAQEPRRAPIQQGLVNGSPDVDAIWRLVMDRSFSFDRGESLYLEPGNWVPFNTQSTWWWPLVYPLLYIPSYCSFRMCDIWKSFVAQRCLWELGFGVAFHAPEVIQERNPHDLMNDFRSEIPGYEGNREICSILSDLVLERDEEAVARNLRCCYNELIKKGFFPESENILLDSWLSDLDAANNAYSRN
ncbi:MAG: STELLO glycosyltransferase family protein [Sedimenticola sp.]